MTSQIIKIGITAGSVLSLIYFIDSWTRIYLDSAEQLRELCFSFVCFVFCVLRGMEALGGYSLDGAGSTKQLILAIVTISFLLMAGLYVVEKAADRNTSLTHKALEIACYISIIAAIQPLHWTIMVFLLVAAPISHLGLYLTKRKS